jgi:hypothetical protein
VSAYEQTTFVTCSECMRLFERGESESWKRRCLDCWRRSKTTEKASTPDPYATGYAAGRAEGLAERMAAHQRGFEAGRAYGRAEAARSAPAVSAIDKTRVRQLLQLVHPDRHGGSALATEVTTWLLEIRKGIAQ